MAGRKRTPEAPQWFKLDAYQAAESLDPGDWLLNLTLRCWLHDAESKANPQRQTEDALRGVGPVLRRNDAAQIRTMHLADRHRWVMSFSSNDFLDPFEAFEEACERPATER